MELHFGDYIFFFIMIALFLHVLFLLLSTDWYHDRMYKRYLEETDHEPGDWITIDDYPISWNYEFFWNDMKRVLRITSAKRD